MPASIIVVITALAINLVLATLSGLMVLLSSASSGSPGATFGVMVRLGLQIGLGALVLIGMIFGHRLAWQWGRLLGLIVAVIFTIGMVGLLLTLIFPSAPSKAENLLETGITFLFILVQAACLYTIFFALGRPSAKKYFGLQCPSCGRYTNQAADFFFNKARCKTCNIKW